MAKQIVAQRKISIRLACDIYGISETCYRYRPSLSVDNRIIADWLLRLSHNQWNWGFGLCFLCLRSVAFFLESQACLPYLSGVGTEYADQAENTAQTRQTNGTSGTVNNQRNLVNGLYAWSAGRWSQLSTIEYTGWLQSWRASIEVDFSISAERVIRALNHLIEWRGKPNRIRCDNGPEYISGTIAAWAAKNGIQLEFIQPGKP